MYMLSWGEIKQTSKLVSKNPFARLIKSKAISSELIGNQYTSCTVVVLIDEIV